MREYSAATPAAEARRRPNSLFVSAATNWIWYSLVIVSGFILPRLIDLRLGQELLGIWDFAWSMVFYVRWLQLGASGAINRYVARYFAQEDWASLNSTVNSCLTMLGMSCTGGVLVAIGFALSVPWMIPTATADAISTGRWVVFLIAFGTLLEMSGSALNSVLSGCGRFDVLNLIRGVREIVMLAGMVVLLTTGHGLVSLAALTLVTAAAVNVCYIAAGKRLCPHLEFSRRHVHWNVMKSTLAFTSKGMAFNMARGLQYHVNGILIAYLLGPATLALYGRQRSLILQMQSMVKQYSFVLVPRSAMLDARGDLPELQRFFVRVTRYGLYLTLPIVLVLAILGGPLLHVWMGPDYVAPWLLGVLAVGHLLSTSQYSVYSVLLGMGRHGRPAIFALWAAIVSTAATFVILKLGGGLVGAALAVSVTVTVNDGFVVPAYACRLLGLGYWRYMRGFLAGPVAACVPFAASLMAFAYFFSHDPLRALVIGLPVSCVPLGIVYWWVVAPAHLRAAVARRLGLPHGPLPDKALNAKAPRPATLEAVSTTAAPGDVPS